MSGEKKKEIKHRTFDRDWDAFKLLTTIKLVKNATFRKNLDTFKLLTTHDVFQNDVKQAHEKLKTALSVAESESKNDEIDLSTYGGLLIDLNTTMLRKFKLPYNFRSAMSVYLQTGKISEKDIPNRNYDFKFIPRPTFTTDGKIVDPVRAVQLVTYTRLTGEELDDAIVSLKKIQSTAFPKTKLFKQTKAHKNLDNELEIEKRGVKRKPAKIKEELTDYWLVLQQNNFESGKITKKEFELYKKQNRNNIRKTKEPGYSARKIAKEMKMGVEPSAIRKIIERLKKERHDRFIEKEDRN